jgi:hypothetical protein
VGGGGLARAWQVLAQVTAVATRDRGGHRPLLPHRAAASAGAQLHTPAAPNLTPGLRRSALLSADARTALGLEPEGSVLVFDEAHNLLDAINGAHGSSVTGAAGLRTRGLEERAVAAGRVVAR